MINLPDKIFIGYIGGSKFWGEVTPETHASNTKYVREDIYESLAQNHESTLQTNRAITSKLEEMKNMTADQLRLHFGELSADDIRLIRATIGFVTGVRSLHSSQLTDEEIDIISGNQTLVDALRALEHPNDGTINGIQARRQGMIDMYNYLTGKKND